MNDLTNILFFNAAIGESNSTVSFSDKRSDTMNQVVCRSRLQVNTIRLDELIVPNSVVNIALLKVDTEGYEKFVFAGGLETLHRTQCVFFECSEGNYAHYGYEPHEVFNILRSCGLSVYKMSGYGKNLLAIRNLPKFLHRMGDPDLVEVAGVR